MMSLRIQFFVTLLLVVVYLGQCCIRAEDEPLFQFNIFKAKSDATNIYGNFVIRAFGINGSLALHGGDGQPGMHEMTISVNEPYNHFLSGIVQVNMLKEDAYIVRSSVNTSFGLRVNSESVFVGQRQEFSLINNSTISHESGVTGTYLLDAHYSPSCPTMSLSHNLTTTPSGIVYFSSNVSEKCDLSTKIVAVPSSSILEINITLQSQLSPLLSVDLQQIFVYNGSNGWESMNCSHPLMDMNVTADWNEDDVNFKQHTKQAIFSSKLLHWLPSFILKYNNMPNNPIELLLSILRTSSHRLDLAHRQHSEL